MTDHPITPPPELVEDWIELAKPLPQRPPNPGELATLAAQWGSDQELETCCKLLELSDSNAREFLTAARRPKPPSLKEQALIELGDVYNRDKIDDVTYDIIRKALEALPE